MRHKKTFLLYGNSLIIETSGKFLKNPFDKGVTTCHNQNTSKTEFELEPELLKDSNGSPSLLKIIILIARKLRF